ncbi:secreted protein [Candidatus Magnetobacterium bavaricum]|uniref:Secreted protein n=1 Tax=Candidatus Magnetobacterium bavaricum TaxID=29290 RepID=A0A0F3GT06_9BACT|nr:secreted protein [Candidatus Magnetobacterium bavaricum]
MIAPYSLSVGTATTFAANVAVTLFAADIDVSVQVELVPVQSPLQPVKVEPEPAVAVRVTDAPETNEATQVEPQLIPSGELTVPLPVPDLEMAKLTKVPTCPLRTGHTERSLDLSSS